MGSDPGALGAAGLITALAALFLSASLARLFLYGVGALRRLGAKEPARLPRLGLSFIFVCLSLGVGLAAWAFVLIGRGSIGLGQLLAYAASGSALGLAFGPFPRAAGSLIGALAIGALALAWLETGAWHASRPGLELARLSVYEADAASSFVSLSAPDRNALPVSQNLRLPPGELRFEAEILSLSGPLGAFFGSRFHRLSALRAGEARIDLPVEGSPLHEPSFLAFLAPLLGFSLDSFVSQGIAAVEFSRASLAMGPGLELALRFE